MNINEIEVGNPLEFEVDRITGNIIQALPTKYTMNIFSNHEIISVEVTTDGVTYFVHKSGVTDPIIIQSCSTSDLICGYLSYRGYSKCFMDFVRQSVQQLRTKVVQNEV